MNDVLNGGVGEIEIEKGIPLPVVMRVRGSVWNELLAKMQVGDSCEISKRHAHTIRQRARVLGVGVTTRKSADGKVRLWRISATGKQNS